ncbi:MAG: cytochrome P460 family protein [Nitrospiraceae bacterium]
MKRSAVVLIATLLVGGLGCAPTPGQTIKPVGPGTVTFTTKDPSQDAEMAKELWRKLEAAQYRDNWATVPGKGTFYRGQIPHGLLLSTYLNPEAERGMTSKRGRTPDNSIIVKENYAPDKTLLALTVMYKEAGYDPEHNDWFWAKYGPDGEIQVAGKGKGCITCHGSVRSNDFIFTFPVAPIKP